MSVSTTPVIDRQDSTQVLLLSDEPKGSEYMQEVIQMSGELIRAAKEDRLVSVVCSHDDSDKKSVVICAMFVAEDGEMASYTPIAQLFDRNWSNWAQLTPPEAASMRVQERE